MLLPLELLNLTLVHTEGNPALGVAQGGHPTVPGNNSRRLVQHVHTVLAGGGKEFVSLGSAVTLGLQPPPLNPPTFASLHIYPEVREPR